MDKLNILVTGIGGGGHGEQALKALKLSKDLDLNIIGTDMTEFTSGKKFIDTFYKIPSASHPDYKKILFDIIKKHNVKFIFHGSEPELAFISNNREKFDSLGVHYYLNSQELIALCMNKYETYKKLGALGFEVPKYLKLDTVDDIEKIDFFPAVLKPYVGSGGSSHVYIATDKEEALLLGRYMLKKGLKVVAQEYIGSADEEYTIGVSSDKDSNVLGSICVKKMVTNALATRLKIPSNEKILTISSGISQGEVCYVPELQQQAEKIAKALNSKGPLNIQCRYIEGKLMLMEINPRISGTTSLRAMAGYNEPEMIIKLYLNNQSWNKIYKNMTIMRALEEIEVK